MAHDPPWQGLLSGRYGFTSKLGDGAYSEVYQAFDYRDKRPVAVKVLTRGQEARFQREAVLLQKIDHPNVASYLNHGKSERGDDFIVFEWLPGEDLAQWLKRRGVCDPKQAVAIIAEAAKGLGALHRAGIVHRDIKPANIFVWERQKTLNVKIIDLGIARDLTIETITDAGALLGTPSYMSPDLASANQKVGPPSDVYSLTTVLYELVTGHKVHAGEELWEIIGQILFQTPIPPRVYNPLVPMELERLIHKGLAKDAGARFPSGQALAEALEVLQKRGFSAPAGPPVAPTNRPSRVREPRVVAVLLYEIPQEWSTDQTRRGSFLGEIHRILNHHEGRLTQLRGNAILGVFGGEQSHGDELFRALRSGHEIMIRFRGKAGVSLGRLGTGPHSGQALSRAAELFRRAPGAGLWLQQPEARRAQSEFLVKEKQGFFQIMGRGDWAAALEKSMVGRLDAVAQLRSYLSGTNFQKTKMLVVTAEDGMGKSRLARELFRMAGDEGLRVVATTAHTEMRDRPYGLLKSLLNNRIGVSEDFSARFAAAVRARFFQGVPGAEVLDKIFQTESITDFGMEADFRWQIWEGVLALVEADLNRGGLLWLVDDFHRADQLTQDLLMWLTRAVSGSFRLSLTLLPEAWESLKPQFQDVGESVVIALSPLTDLEAASLIQGLNASISEPARKAICRRAGGSPLFLEELAFLHGDGGKRRALTHTIEAAVQAALDRLAPQAVTVAKAAAVLGERGSMQALAALLPQLSVENYADVLVSGNIWRRPPSTGPRAKGFHFKHRLTRDAVLALLPTKNRASYHLLAAHFFDGGDPRDPLRAAIHFRAAKNRPGAIRCLLEASKLANAAADSRTTLKTVAQLFDLGVEGDEKRAARLLRAQARTWEGQLSLGLEDVRVILDDPKTASEQRAQAACLGCLQLRRLANVEEGRKLAEIAIVEAAITFDATLMARSLFHAAFAHYDAGDAGGIEACLAKLRALNSSNPVIASYAHEVEVLDANAQAELERSYQACLQTLAINRNIKKFTRLGANTANTGLTLIMLGRYREALVYLRESRAIYTRQHNHLQVYDAMLNEGRILGELGSFDQGLTLLEEAFEGLNRAGERHFSGVALAVMARIMARRGHGQDLASATTIVTEKLRLEEQSPLHALEQAIAAMEVLLSQDQAEAALPFVTFTLKTLAASLDNNEWAAEALAYAALVFRACQHELAGQVQARALNRIAFLIGRCREFENRESLRCNIRAYRQFLDAVRAEKGGYLEDIDERAGHD